MRNGGSLLVIDELPDTAEVLKAIFEPRGVRVDRSRSPEIVAKNAVEAPAVVVIDCDSWRSPDSANLPWAASPRVFIGQTRAAIPAAAGDTHSTEFLGKPFHYAELIRAIEHLMRAD